MTRKGAAKSVDPARASIRLEIARAYHQAARHTAALVEDGTPANPIVSQIVTAAVAYADALTAKHAGTVNQKDHGAVVKTLRDVLGQRLPKAQETNLRMILQEKDTSQYGFRIMGIAEAQRLLDRLDAFAAWAEQAYDRP